MTIHFLPKKAEALLSDVFAKGIISLDDILELSKCMNPPYSNLDSGRKTVCYILWRIFLSYANKYDGDPMTFEQSKELVSKLASIKDFLKYLNGSVEKTPDEVIEITSKIIDLL